MEEEYDDYLYLYDEDEEPKKKDPWYARVKQLFYDIHNLLIIGLCSIAMFFETIIIVCPRVKKLKKLSPDDLYYWLGICINSMIDKYYHEGSWADHNLIE